MKTDAKTDAQGLGREEAVELLSFFSRHRLLPQITRVLFSLGLATSQASHPRDLRSLLCFAYLRQESSKAVKSINLCTFSTWMV